MAPPKSTVVAWNFVQKYGFNLSCQLCGHNFTGTLTRSVDHLLGISNGSGGGVKACTKITDEQKATVQKDHSNSQMQKQKRVNKRQRIERELAMSSSNTINSISNIGGSSSTQAKTGGTRTLNQFWKPVEKQEVDDVVAKYFYACAIPFNVARSPSFKNVIKKAIDFGKGYVPPGSEALRTTLLKRTKDRVTRKLADIKESWKLTGCTILSDGWSDLCHCPLINVLVYCPQGVLFLKAINAMDQVKTSEFIFGILDEAIQEVGVENVVHVVTDNASNCVGVGKLIMEKYNQIYWTPYAAHCLDLMLHDLAKFLWVNETIRRAKTISNFIINHRLTLSIYRKNASKELLRPCDTRWKMMHSPLHAAACYLDPRLFGLPRHRDEEIMNGLIQSIEKLNPDPDIAGAPELQNFAILILSHGTSASACERNWSSFDHIHSKKRNRLLSGRLEDLVYVRSNLQLALKNVAKE
eukprot:PITA_19249